MNELNYEHVREVVMDLVHSNKRKLAHELIDLYFKKASKLEHYDVLGNISLKSDYREMYLTCAERVYSLTDAGEQKKHAMINLHKAYSTMNMPEKALFYVDLLLKNDPNDFETITAYAFNQSLLGNKEESEKIVIELAKQYPHKQADLRSSLSSIHLREGRTAQGILDFLNASKPKENEFTKKGIEKWNGVPVPGMTLYVVGEGGIGDEIINIRFFKHVQELGMNPVLYSSWASVRNGTVDLFRRNGYNVLTDTYTVLRNNAAWVGILELPGIMGVAESDLWKGPYLTPLRQEKNKIQSNKFKIGIKCSGNPYFQQEQYRKIPVEQMLSYMPKDAEIYYLDKDVVVPGTNSVKIDTWEDTLDIIDQMDCVVSSCTSLIHAAGAIGKTAFVAVPILSYYVWNTTRTDNTTAWYGDNLRVYKQQKVRSWIEPLHAIQHDLNKLVSK